VLEVLSEIWIWEFTGRLHPLVVHFPIALLITAFFLELFTISGKRQELRPGIKWLVYIGAFTSLLSAIAGYMLAFGGNYPATTLDYHQWTGIATVLLATIAAWLLYRAGKSEKKKDLNIYRSVLAITVLLLTFAGHYGASLTHGSDYLTSVLPWNYETSSRGEYSELLIEIAEHRELGPLAETHLNELNLGVRRIFANSCYRCHASDTDADGGLELDSEEAVMAGGDGGPIIIPGQPGDSEIIRRLTLPSGHDEVMPQRGRALYNEEIELIRVWIEMGAHWADEEMRVFREAELALVKPEVPDAVPGIDHPIDLFVNRYFKEHGITWQEPVEDEIFIRRVYMDLIGLLPEPGEVQTFISDSSPYKRENLIDELLDREHDYAQHSLSFWNDLLRNAYTGTGFITGGRKQVTDWLYEALYENKPYNQMVRELVSPDESSEGFIRGIQWRGDFNSSQSTEMQAAQNISQSLMGVNLKCASCHNSFTSNLTLKEAYGFAAVFSDTILTIERCEVPTGDLAEPGFYYSELGEIDGDLTRNERLEVLADILADDKNGRLYRTISNRYWAQLMGRGLVEPTDEMDLEPWNQDLLDWLAADLIENDYDLKYLISSMMKSRTYQLPSVGISETEMGATEDYIFRGPHRKRLTAEQFTDALSQLAAPVYSSVSFDPFNSNTAPAAWIWYDMIIDDRRAFSPPGDYYFRYTFDIPSDDRITDAEVLITADQSYELYINGTLKGTGQDWRQVQRIDVTSSLSSGQNLLAVKGSKGGTTPEPAGILLNLRISYAGGGEIEVNTNGDWKVVSNQPAAGWESIDFDDSDWKSVRVFGNSVQNNYWGRLVEFTHDSAGERLVFVRASLVPNDPFQTAMGRPAREIVATSRENDPTLLQALELTNGETVYDVLGRGADRWMAHYGDNPDELIRQIFFRALNRQPSEREVAVAQEILAPDPTRDSVQDLLWAVVMLPEFQMIY
jgi:uncharacterized membrane protein